MEALRSPQRQRDKEMSPVDIWGEPISRYTRAQALADGVLVDATPLARECGFKYPVALTSAAWAAVVAVPSGVVPQDEQGRLWDVLVMLLHAIRSARSDGREIRFGVHVRQDNRDRVPPLVRLKALCGPGDEGEPVLAILLPNED